MTEVLKTSASTSARYSCVSKRKTQEFKRGVQKSKNLNIEQSGILKRKTQEFKEVCRNLNKEQIEAAFKRFDQTGEISIFNTFHYNWKNFKIE